MLLALFQMEHDNKEKNENSKKMMLAGQLAASAPIAVLFQPKAELHELQLIPYTEA